MTRRVAEIGVSRSHTYRNCSPVTRTSAMRSSSAAFFCMVFPMPSISDSPTEHEIIHTNVTNQRSEEKTLFVKGTDTHSVLEFVLGVLNTPLIRQIGDRRDDCYDSLNI